MLWAGFIAQKVRNWIAAVGAKTAYIEPGSPWENGYCASFNARFRDGLLNGELFYTSKEAQILIERWRVHYNTVRPHSAQRLSPTRAGNHRSDGPEAHNAQTLNRDHPMGARHIWLVQRFRSLGWDNTQLHDASPFQVVDRGFNAILIRSCEDVANLAGRLGMTDIAAMESLWNETLGQYQCHDRAIGAGRSG